MTKSTDKALKSSFRDPNGFLFYRNEILYRQINVAYKTEYQKLISSGLYTHLSNKGLLIKHEESNQAGLNNDSFLVIKPEIIPFISYAYEWCFSQLKDAALLTLNIQLEALKKGMSLKDASAYNVQFVNDKPVFIDTLSFETYQEGNPWVGYKQFCQHFLAPLALMSHTDIRLNKLLINFIDGVPLDLASSLLPLHTKFSLSLGLHIHLHSKQQTKSSEKVLDKNKVQRSMPKRSLIALIDSLKNSVAKLTWKPTGTEWHDYYISNNNYQGESLSFKETLVSRFIVQCQANTVWDLGANDGRFSRIAKQHAQHVVSWDIDPACVENNYLTIKKHKEQKILPLLIDLANPSPGIGWANEERDSFTHRGPCDVVLSLGLIHHLAISNNLPLERIAESFSRLGKHLIIEFVPKDDSQVIKLLNNRPDIFPDYDLLHFEEIFLRYFSIEAKQKIEDTVRTLYLLKAK
jgi:ribosomal protein L11 methylase PrmA